jgi:hypothetical protein
VNLQQVRNNSENSTSSRYLNEMIGLDFLYKAKTVSLRSEEFAKVHMSQGETNIDCAYKEEPEGAAMIDDSV